MSDTTQTQNEGTESQTEQQQEAGEVSVDNIQEKIGTLTDEEIKELVGKTEVAPTTSTPDTRKEESRDEGKTSRRVRIPSSVSEEEIASINEANALVRANPALSFADALIQVTGRTVAPSTPSAATATEDKPVAPTHQEQQAKATSALDNLKTSIAEKDTAIKEARANLVEAEKDYDDDKAAEVRETIESLRDEKSQLLVDLKLAERETTATEQRAEEQAQVAMIEARNACIAKMFELYPESKNENSDFSLEIQERIEKDKTKRPTLAFLPDYPLIVAREVAEEMGIPSLAFRKAEQKAAVSSAGSVGRGNPRAGTNNYDSASLLRDIAALSDEERKQLVQIVAQRQAAMA